MLERQWTFQLLGGLAARQGDRVITRFRTRKTAALLVYLVAAKPGVVLPRDTVMEAIWPESDLAAARNKMNVALSSLRAQFEPPSLSPGDSPLGTLLISDRSSLYLNPDAYTTDVVQFETLVAQAKRGGDNDIARLTEAIGLYVGELLPGFFDDWIFGERDRLAALYQQALIHLTTRLIATGCAEAAYEYAQRAVRAEPLNEEPHRLLMRVYSELGRADAVHAQLRELEQRRSDAGEAPPLAETRWLAHRLADQTTIADKIQSFETPSADTKRIPTLSHVSPPVLDLAPPVPHHLPLPITRFFGQEESRATIHRLLTAPTPVLLTLIGPGGSGKSRLSLEAARAVVMDRTIAGEHVWFVPLAGVTDAASLGETVRDSLRLPRVTREEPMDQITAYLQDAPTALLILDNAEHLLGRGPLDPTGAAAFVRNIRSRLPRLRLLVTSRQALGIADEQVFPVPLLAVPLDASLPPAALLEFASVQLFADRARNRRVDFQVTPRNAGSVARLVKQLEGIPLAIELAAAWSQTLSPAQIEERLSRRFEMLVSSDRARIPERQRTLWGALEWSYDLLSLEARRVLAVVSVFRGDWSVEAAEAVCEQAGGNEPEMSSQPPGRSLECLTQLLQASLLTANEGTETMRLRLLESVREFASAQLTGEERAVVEARHAAYFKARSAQGFQHRYDSQQKLWFDRLEEDLPNYRAVLERTLTMPLGMDVFCNLVDFWKTRGYGREAHIWIDRFVATNPELTTDFGATIDLAADNEQILIARFLNGAGTLADDMGDTAKATAFYTRSAAYYAAWGDAENVAMVRGNLGIVAFKQGERDRARQWFQEALDYARRANHGRLIPSMLVNLGTVASPDEAYHFYKEGLAIAREVGDHALIGSALQNLGSLAYQKQDLPRARILYEESLVAKQALGDRRGIAIIHITMGFLALEEGRVMEGAGLFANALQTMRELGQRYWQLNGLEGLGWCAAFQQPLLAAHLWGAAQEARTALTLPWANYQRDKFLALQAKARAIAPTSAAYDAAWKEGSMLSLDAAVSLALTHFPSNCK